MHGKPDAQFKIVLVGDSGVGKTSLIYSFLSKQFNHGAMIQDFESVETYCRFKNNIIKLSLWDTSGKRQYDNKRPLSYTRADIFLICFGIDQPKSFRHATEKWINQVRKYVSDPLIMFVCTKMDKSRQFYQMDLKQKPSFSYLWIQNKIRIMQCQLTKCSSLQKEGVQQAFQKAIQIVINKTYPQLSIQQQQYNRQCQLV